MTTAEKIAARYDNDGQRWRDTDGIDLDDACRAVGAQTTWRGGYRIRYISNPRRHGDTYRYDFPDGSSITVAGAAWDIGYPDCFCWRDDGHSGCDCPLSPDYEGVGADPADM